MAASGATGAAADEESEAQADEAFTAAPEFEAQVEEALAADTAAAEWFEATRLRARRPSRTRPNGLRRRRGGGAGVVRSASGWRSRRPARGGDQAPAATASKRRGLERQPTWPTSSEAAAREEGGERGERGGRGGDSGDGRPRDAGRVRAATGITTRRRRARRGGFADSVSAAQSPHRAGSPNLSQRRRASGIRARRSDPRKDRARRA